MMSNHNRTMSYPNGEIGCRCAPQPELDSSQPLMATSGFDMVMQPQHSRYATCPMMYQNLNSRPQPQPHNVPKPHTSTSSSAKTSDLLPVKHCFKPRFQTCQFPTINKVIGRGVGGRRTRGGTRQGRWRLER